uniref:Putative secreted protein n=1 Tax=Anopheles darlingi TaxID=43151 RepID=A0A2M4DR49_ANODA
MLPTACCSRAAVLQHVCAFCIPFHDAWCLVRAIDYFICEHSKLNDSYGGAGTHEHSHNTSSLQACRKPHILIKNCSS